MSERVKFKAGIIIVKQNDGLFVGHLHDYEIFTDVHILPIIYALREWTPIDQLLITHSDEFTTITHLIARLEDKNFLERSRALKSTLTLIISHMNELGTLLAPILIEKGHSVTTLDNRSSQISDVRGHYLRISDAGAPFKQIIAAQKREIRNSGNQRHSSEQDESDLFLFGQSLAPKSGIPHRALVLITTYPEPELLASLMESGIDYFCAFSTPSGAIIGPFVRPGVTPCFHCIELTRSSSDGEWQKVAATLFIERYTKVEMAPALLTTALLVEKIGRVLEGEFPHDGFTESSAISFTGGQRAPELAPLAHRTWSWGFHPECSCHWR